MVRAAGLEPARGRPRRIFLPLRLSPPPIGVCGLDYPFTLASCEALGAARLVSTPSRFRAWLGIASEGFPDFEQLYVPGFPERTQCLA